MEKANLNDSMCRICKNKIYKLTDSHLKMHGISFNDYILLFGENDKAYVSCSYSIDSIREHKCNIMTHSDCQFCILHNDNKNKVTELFSKTFRAMYNLYKVTNSDFHFEGIIFPADIDFSNLEFNKVVYFYGCKFNGIVRFNNVFQEYVDFKMAVFFENVEFNHSKFLKDVKFSNCKFFKNTSFHEVKFLDNVSFWNIEFIGNTSFRYTCFKNRVSFGDDKFPNPPYEMHFIATIFEKPKESLFSGVNLSTTFFRYTNLSEIYFENITWPKTSKLFGSRRYLLDENFPETIKKIGNVHFRYSKYEYYIYAQQLYRQLKWNYEETKNYSEAGDFYYGEMECYRKSNRFRRYLPSLLNLYRISSGYGQRYFRAFIVLIVMLMTFSTAHIFMGLEPNGHNKYYSNIKYSLDSMFSNIDTFSSDLLLSAVYCVEVLTREDEPDRLFRPMRLGGEILNSTFSLLVYIQVLFFILALRRHFKR